MHTKHLKQNIKNSTKKLNKGCSLCGELTSLRGLVDIEETVTISGTPVKKRVVLKQVIETLKILSPGQLKKINQTTFKPKVLQSLYNKIFQPKSLYSLPE